VERKFSQEEINELQKAAEWDLISHGEYCTISRIAKEIVYKTLAEFTKSESLIYTILPSLLRNVRRVCETSGKLVFIKINKGYFRSAFQ